MRRELACALLAAACASPPPGPTAARDALSGFDAPAEATEWRSGDRVAFQLAYADGESRRRWSVQLALLPLDSAALELAPRSAQLATAGGERTVEELVLLRPARVEVSEEPSGALEVETLGISDAQLSAGIYASCARLAGRDPSDELDGEDLLAWSAGAGVLRSVLDAVQRSDELSRVLREVVRAPSLLSLATHGGARLTIEPDFARARTIASPLPGAFAELPAYALPVRLLLNGELALEGELVCVPPRTPLHLAGGLVRLRGHHPDRPERTVTVELVAARRGE